MITRLPASWLNHNSNTKKGYRKKKRGLSSPTLDRVGHTDIAFYERCGRSDVGVIALDLGIRTGWAMGTRGVSGTTYLQGGTHNNHHTDKSRQFRKFHQFLNGLTERVKHHHLHFVRIYYEKVMHHTGLYAAHTYGGFEALLMAWCDTLDMDLVGIVPTDLKKRATGHGHADKDSMTKSAALLWPSIPIDDHNHADALCLLHVALSLEANKFNELNTKKG